MHSAALETWDAVNHRDQPPNVYTRKTAVPSGR